MNVHPYRPTWPGPRWLAAICALALAGCGRAPTATPPPEPGLTAQPPTVTAAAPPPTTTAQPAPTATASGFGLGFLAVDGDPRPMAAAQSTAAELGWRFETTSATAAEAAAALQQLAAQGAGVIVVEGSALGDATRAAAAEWPAVYFIALGQADGNALPGNVLNLGGPEDRLDQAGFLAGMVAGFATETERVAVVSDTTSAAGRKYRNGFLSGVRYTCPKCRLDTLDLSETAATEFARAEAVKYAALGADVIFAAAGPAGEAALLGAAEAGAWVIGSNRDARVELFGAGGAPGADQVLTSVYADPGAALAAALRAYQAGQSFSGVQPLSLANAGIGLAPLHDPAGRLEPLDVQDVETARQRLAERALETGVDPATGDER